MENKERKHPANQQDLHACSHREQEPSTPADKLCASVDNQSVCLACNLRSIALPLWGRLDQLIESTERMLQIISERTEQTVPNLDLKQQLIDNHDLKAILKVKETKYSSMKKKFKSYEIDSKQYYLEAEILEVIRKHEVKSKYDKDD